MHEGFIDLDELIVSCLDKVSRKFIQEAVACYRAGAYRSCIVSTWNAVVFDFINKLKELEIFGDPQASELLEEFENLRSSGNKFKELWDFESRIPDIALDKFELISNIEKSDIERLFKDRSRCAHPSMTSLEEPFEATAELARYHLRSAIMHLLQRPPVQGRAASKRIFQDIKSQYFPTDAESALSHLKSSPMARARFTLIKDVVIGLTKGLLIENNPENENSRILAALNGVSLMYPKETLEILNSQLSKIINRVDDENLQKVVVYLGSVSQWNSLSEACRLKLNCFMENLDIFEPSTDLSKDIDFSKEAIFILKKASYIEFLIPVIINKLQLSIDKLLELIEISKDDLFKEKIIIPILKEWIPKAELFELISMRTEPSLRTNENIQSCIIAKIKNYSQLELTQTLYSQLELTQTLKPFGLKDEWFIHIIESELENKIIEDDLETLLKAKLYYKVSIRKPKDKIIELFNKCIEPLIKSASITDLLKSNISLEQVSEEVINPILKNNIDAVINNYKNSSSWESAGKNTALLVRVAENLTTEQWTDILESFFKNSELYVSFSCLPQLECLFKKSLELNNCVRPYWSSFRKKLDTLTFNKKSITNLKNLIDSHLVDDF